MRLFTQFRGYGIGRIFRIYARRWHCIAPAAVIGGVVLYKFHSNNSTPIKNNFPFLPVLTAKSNDSEKSNKRTLMYNFIADAVEKVAPSVVYIGVGTIPKGAVMLGGFRQFPGNTVGYSSSGSGFVVTEDGIVLTSAHVVGGVSKHHSVDIKFPSGETYKGYVIDVDEKHDLAAIKLRTDPEVKFTPVNLGKSTEVRVGEWVAALGSPLGLSNTVTSGIISTLHRSGEELMLRNKDTEYIQTDAPINTGNSGGPLINLDGEVIGINCMTAQDASGISFAVPSDVVSSFLQGAVKKAESLDQGKGAEGREKYFIGISMLTLTPSILRQFQSRMPHHYGSVEGGVWVGSVNPQSPAKQCGLNVGDVIISVNGKSMKSTPDIFAEVEKGEVMDMVVQRGRDTFTIHIKPQLANKL